MYKVTAFIGSARKNATYRACQEFEKSLKNLGDVDFQYVFLSDYHLEFCRSCKVCFERGEDFCPEKDDRDLLLSKIECSDGVIFATPNYAFQVSARMKNLLDRLAFILHRPRFFDKVFTAIVTQGLFGGKGILKYLENMGANFGFQVTRGASLTTLEPMTIKQETRLVQETKKAAERFYSALSRSTTPTPSLFRLMIFRMARTSYKNIAQKYRDYYYYKEKGWFESDYYYEVKLGLFKRLAGRFFDVLGRQMAKKMS